MYWYVMGRLAIIVLILTAASVLATFILYFIMRIKEKLELKRRNKNNKQNKGDKKDE